MALNRQATGYEPRFDIDFEYGAQAELFVTDIIASLKTASIEVKHDSRFQDTGKLYVEYECDKGRKGHYTPSGLAASKAKLWAFVLDWQGEQLAFVVPTELLKAVCRPLFASSRTVATTKGSCPTNGIALPLSTFINERRS